MKNAETPANPISFEATNKIDQGYGYNLEFSGLTKREHFAGLAMQGLLTRRNQGKEDLVAISYEIADEMLKESK